MSKSNTTYVSGKLLLLFELVLSEPSSSSASASKFMAVSSVHPSFLHEVEVKKSVEIRTMLRYDLILKSLELDCVTN